ncbi:MAG: SRPBCC family protein [Arcobacteraceae bacterium]|jgi:ligand-binding SRPBCC domain-containing protein|nr:SRPBCC family protein [Arcobacteraceae bacterium]
METFTQTSLINCTLEKLFDFHLDTNNIKLITPSHTKVELIEYEEATFEGKIIKLKTTRAWVPIDWIVKIEKYEYPNLMVDVALKSPFVFWEHQHIFTKKGSMCELKDVIKYKLPFGILGKLIAPFIKKDIANMFDYRHKQTKQILEN